MCKRWQMIGLLSINHSMKTEGGEGNGLNPAVIFTGGYRRFREFGGCRTRAVTGGSGANGLSGDFQIAAVTIKFQNSLNWYIWFTSTSYQCSLNLLKTQAIFIILAVLIIKHVQRVLPQLHAKCAIIRTLTVTYGTLQKTISLACPSLFFQFDMHISVIYDTLSVPCKRVVSVFSFLASNSCGGSHFLS